MHSFGVMTVFSEGISDLWNPSPAQYHSEYQLKSCQDMQRSVMQMWCERQKHKNSSNKSSKSHLQQRLQYMQLNTMMAKTKALFSRYSSVKIFACLLCENLCTFIRMNRNYNRTSEFLLSSFYHISG